MRYETKQSSSPSLERENFYLFEETRSHWLALMRRHYVLANHQVCILATL